MKYATVLFDLDGTLLDTLDDMTDAVNRTMRRFSLPERSRGEIRSFVGNGARRLIELASGAEGDRLEKILADYKADYDANYLVKTAPYPGVMALLMTLRAQGRHTGIISNKPDSTVKQLNDALFQGLADIAVGDRAGIRRKPAPDTVLAAMEALGAKAEETVYVGDSDVDVATARAAGVPCISVTWGYRDRDVLAAAGAWSRVSEGEGGRRRGQGGDRAGCARLCEPWQDLGFYP